MALQENGPTDPKYIPDGLEDEVKAQLRTGIPEDVLRKSAAESYTSFMSWVEPTEMWLRDDSAAGGRLLPFSNLILTSEISPRAEPHALDALGGFLSTD